MSKNKEIITIEEIIEKASTYIDNKEQIEVINKAYKFVHYISISTKSDKKTVKKHIIVKT